MTKRKARRKVVAQSRVKSREAAVLSFPPSFARNFHRERDVRVRDRCETKSETHFC